MSTIATTNNPTKQALIATKQALMASNPRPNVPISHSQDPVLGRLPYAGPACSDPVRSANVIRKRIMTADLVAQAYAIQALNSSLTGAEQLEDVWSRRMEEKKVNEIPRLMSFMGSNRDKSRSTICERAAEAEFQAAKRLLEKMNVQIKLVTSEDVRAQTQRIEQGNAPVAQTESNKSLLYVGVGFFVISALIIYYIIKKRQA